MLSPEIVQFIYLIHRNAIYFPSIFYDILLDILLLL